MASHDSIMTKVLKHVQIKMQKLHASPIWGKVAISENIHQTINTEVYVVFKFFDSWY